MQLSILIPIYNENRILEKNINEILHYFLNKFDFEIIIINDGSTDNSNEILKKFTLHNIKIINNTKNEGKGASIRKGVKNCKGDLILISDADLSTPINQFSVLYKKYLEGYDFVIGSRSKSNSKILVKQKKMRVVAGVIFNYLVKIILGLKYHDTQCGFKLFNKQKLNNIINFCDVNRFCIDVEILFLAKKFNYKIFEIGIVWKNDFKSSVSLIKDSLMMFCDLIKIRLKKY